jgi:prepilin-type N-terminal cleavage/methylation domain-containing protein
MPMPMSDKDKTRVKSGYTMLEIMIVVGILTVIVTMAIPSITRTKKHAYETAAIEGLRAIGDAEELYYEVSGYYTGGGNQIQDLRKVDAIDSGSYGASAGEGVFIKGYSIQFVNIGEHAQNYSVAAVPIIRGMNLRTFFLEGDGIIIDQSGNIL